MAFQFARFLVLISCYQEDILALSNEFSDDFRFVFVVADCFIASIIFYSTSLSANEFALTSCNYAQICFFSVQENAIAVC